MLAYMRLLHSSGRFLSVKNLCVCCVGGDSGAVRWLVVLDRPPSRGSSPERGEPSEAAVGGWLDARDGGLAYRP